MPVEKIKDRRWGGLRESEHEMRMIIRWMPERRVLRRKIQKLSLQRERGKIINEAEFLRMKRRAAWLDDHIENNWLRIYVRMSKFYATRVTEVPCAVCHSQDQQERHYGLRSH